MSGGHSTAPGRLTILRKSIRPMVKTRSKRTVKIVHSPIKDKVEDKYKNLLRAHFSDLAIYKAMTNKEILGMILRDDQFLNLLASDQEEIRHIWQKQIGEDEDE